ncbi:UNVERIFIED_CONTAM: Intraflagellar transport protein 43 [Siphonaria sp. JEL0065]|nr:Intraflagellar transport protein 43 [Siphonaria sp. JEL0065]
MDGESSGLNAPRLSDPVPPPTAPKGRRNRTPFRSGADDGDAKLALKPKSADFDDETSNSNSNENNANESGAPPGVATSTKQTAAAKKAAVRAKNKQSAKSGWAENSQLEIKNKRFGRRSKASRTLVDQEDSGENDEDDGDEDDEGEDEDVEEEKGPARNKDKNKDRRSSGRDDVIMIIPDLNDVEEDEMITTVAAPPSLKVNKVKTIRELDNELAISTGMLNETGLEGIDFSLLTAYALCPPEMVYEEDKHWDWDVTFAELSTAEEIPAV